MHNAEDRSFIGHPRGLGYLAFTEAWERFSYYGMQSLLVLYMINRLLHPGHIERVAGFGPFRHLLESVYRGPLSVAGARFSDFRSLHRSGLSHADRRRIDRRPLARTHPHNHDRFAPHGGRAFSDGV